MFEVTGSDFAALTDVELRTLVARLALAELRKAGLPQSSVTAGGNQTAPDGGLDVRVSVPGAIAPPDFVPRQETGFQVKKPDMNAWAIKEEMSPKGRLRSVSRELADKDGAYIIVSAQGSVADKLLQDRNKAMRDALSGMKDSARLLVDFYDRDRMATWANSFKGVAAWVMDRVGRRLSGWSAIGKWSGTGACEADDYLSGEKTCVIDERDAGRAFSEYRDKAMRNLTCKRLQVDEIWSFVHCKAKNVETAKAAPAEAGDIWTWTAIDLDTKLISSFYVGKRDADAAFEFIGDVAFRLANRVQLTGDGHKPYLEALEESFGADIDYAQMIKAYGDAGAPPGRYSPAPCVGSKRRFTRLTNGFSKKAENRAHAVAIYFMHYNFVRIHQTLRCTPAMAAGVTTKLWELVDMVAVLEEWEAQQKS